MFVVRRILIAITLLILSVGVSASAATQPSPDDPNLQAILQAFSIARREGYHFTTQMLNTLTYMFPDGSTPMQYISVEQEGDVAADENFQETTKFRFAPIFEALKTFKPLTLTSVVYDGEHYIYLKPTDRWSTAMFAVHAGWWCFADFRSQVSEPEGSLVDANIVVRTPADSIIGRKFILGVDYTGTERVDNHEMRNYTLHYNVLWGLLDELPGTGGEHFASIQKYARLFLSSHLSLTFQLQIGADDGRLYHMVVDSRRYLPYKSAGYTSESPYDAESDSTVDITFIYPDQPVVVTPPDSSLLNH